MSEKQKQQVFRRAFKAIEHIDKAIEAIRKSEDKVSYESPDYHLMCSATCFLSDARGELVTLANRNKTNRRMCLRDRSKVCNLCHDCDVDVLNPGNSIQTR